ncbi:MFS family permease [Kibdelosporangium banguiense]|uniref:MFS family permease n=1 Tax=Kibdelosporangium banguiense TaxID=1365924 RepID=A0ABS4U3F7_9PSEU|nr:MFS transporter [Kibdelosporangium banguiense]MBP2331204.1 MFS family permease [Kibdelosporangium banguiense]
MSDEARFPGEVWVLLSATFLVTLGFGVMAPVVPALATSFGVGITAASFIVSAFSIVRLLFAPMGGRLVSKFAERRVLLAGLALNGVATAACGWAGSYTQLLVFRSIAGIGSVMFTVAGIGLILRLSPAGLRGRAAGMWSTSALLGNMAGPLLGGLIAGSSLRLPFIAYGGSTLLAALIVWLLLRHSVHTAPSAVRDLPEFTVRQAVRTKAYRAALASSFANGWVTLGVRFALIPLFVVYHLGGTSVTAGITLTVYAVGTASTLLLSGRIADRKGRRPVALAGLTVLTMGVLALGLAESMQFLVGAALIAGIGSGMINPAQTATVADVIGTQVRGGPVLATFQMAADLGAIVGPVVAGALADMWSYQAAFSATAVISVLALAVWLRAPETLVGGAVSAPPTKVSQRQAEPGSEVCGPAADTSSS